MTDSQCHDDKVVDAVRRSRRVSQLTEKTAEMQEMEKEKKVQKRVFRQRYEAWKVEADASRKQMKHFCPVDSLNIVYKLKASRDDIIRDYERLRTICSPDQELRCHIRSQRPKRYDSNYINRNGYYVRFCEVICPLLMTGTTIDKLL